MFRLSRNDLVAKRDIRYNRKGARKFGMNMKNFSLVVVKNKLVDDRIALSWSALSMII
jgi:hypothetical protein